MLRIGVNKWSKPRVLGVPQTHVIFIAIFVEVPILEEQGSVLKFVDHILAKGRQVNTAGRRHFGAEAVETTSQSVQHWAVIIFGEHVGQSLTVLLAQLVEGEQSLLG
jgi:hypothetical protein